MIKNVLLSLSLLAAGTVLRRGRECHRNLRGRSRL